MGKHENDHTLEIIAGIGLFLGTLFISQLAFSDGSRDKIRDRDNWTCQERGCHKSYYNGWMVHAAHKPEHHSLDDPLYDDPSSGDLRCVEHHIRQHEKGTSLGPEEDQLALNLLRGVNNHTQDWLVAHHYA